MKDARRIGVYGASGSGKSTLVKAMIGKAPRVVVFDPMDEYARALRFHRVTTLAGVHLNLPRYERRHVDGCWLEFPTVIEQSRRLASLSVPDRALHPCIGEERADLVVAGCAILEALYRFWPATRLRVADRGVREGVLVELMRQRRRQQHGRRP